MPVYDYECAECGPFTAMRPMSECELPKDCPDCGSSTPRAYLTAPRLSGLSAERRLAHATNERSANAPRTASSTQKHGAGCACCSGRSSRSTRRGRDGSKSFPASRPWMISH
jgi:putative FmdB family regulatory protein